MLHCLRQRKKLGKSLLVPWWKEQLLMLLLGHTEEAQGFGEALCTYNSTHLPTALSFLCFSHQLDNSTFPCLLLLSPRAN